MIRIAHVVFEKTSTKSIGALRHINLSKKFTPETYPHAVETLNDIQTLQSLNLVVRNSFPKKGGTVIKQFLSAKLPKNCVVCFHGFEHIWNHTADIFSDLEMQTQRFNVTNTRLQTNKFLVKLLEEMVAKGKVTSFALSGSFLFSQDELNVLTKSLQLSKIVDLDFAMDDFLGNDHDDITFNSRCFLTAIANSFDSLQNLKQFTFRVDAYAPFEIVINAFIRSKVYLKKLTLACTVKQECLDLLGHYLLQNDSMEELLLCDVDCDGDSFDFTNFCSAVKQHKSLKRLDVNGVEIDQKNALLWEDALSGNTSLQTVSFRGNYCMVFDEQSMYYGQVGGDNFFLNILDANRCLKKFYVDNTIYEIQVQVLATGISRNLSIQKLSRDENSVIVTDEDEEDDESRAVVQSTLERNREIYWRPSLHEKLLDYCIAMSALKLPPYVLLWIFNCLPLMSLVNQYRKIRLIDSVAISQRRVEEKRNNAKLLKTE